MSSEREFIGSPWSQGEDERRPYQWDASEWGFTALDSAATVLKDRTDPDDVTDVSGDNITGTTTVNGTTVTTGVVHSLAAGRKYRLEIKVTQGTRVEEGYGIILAEV